MKYIYLTFLLSFGFIGFSQEITEQDALRYAIQDLTGTARFKGMSGAFGAVGGDLSSININPAGSVLFKNNFASITATNFNNYNKANYFGTKTRENLSDFDLNQIGAVLVFVDNNEDNDWKKFSVALNYENTNNFDNALFSTGLNPYNSIGNYFVNMAQGIPETNLASGNYYNYGFAGQQAYIGYQTYIIEPVTSNTYTSNVPSGGNYYHQNYITSTGYNGKLTGNFASSYKNFLFLGANLNVHFTDYVKTSSLVETNNNPLNPNPNSTIDYIRFDNEIYTYGTGFSLNLGAIVQATKSFRFGLAYESPTWYRLNDELLQGLETISINNPDNNPNPYIYTDKNIYPTYKLQTPSKWTGSMVYIYKNKGLISVDFTTKNYGNTTFRPRNEIVYQNLNSNMSQNLDNAIELRIGGEYKIKQVSLRAGYRFEESPYKVDYTMGDLTGYTGGIGYNFGESRLDLAYSNSHRNYNNNLISSGMNDIARIRTINNNITVTYSINF